MDWTYNGKPFNPTPEVIEDYQGFVYELEEISTGKKYIGKKFFWSKRRLPPLKGKSRKRIVKKESDWRDYYGSSEEVKLLVDAEESWIQKAIDLSVLEQRRLWLESERESLEAVQAAGVKVSYPDKTLFSEKSKSVLDEYQKDPDLKIFIEIII